MPIDPKGFHYFLVIIELACRRVDAEPLKDKHQEISEADAHQINIEILMNINKCIIHRTF
jgi:hypothetical protein